MYCNTLWDTKTFSSVFKEVVFKYYVSYILACSDKEQKLQGKPEESLPVDLSQHFPESEPQHNDVSICRLFDMSHTAVSIMALVISKSLPRFLQLFSDILTYTLFML